MNRKAIPIGTALDCCAAFLLLTLKPGGCAFNMLPYMIHQSIPSDGVGESRFIEIIDILVAVGIFLAVYRILKPMFQKKA